MRLLFEYLPGMDLTTLGGTFTRATTATYVDRNGVVRTAASGVLRDGHYIDGVRHLLVEKSGTNLCVQSENFGAWGLSGTPTRTAAAHTSSGVTLDLLGDNDGASEEYFTNGVALTGNGVKALSLYVKRGPNSSSAFVGLYDTTSGTYRVFAAIAFDSAGVPVLSGVTGTYHGYEVLKDGVYRLLFSSTTVIAANSHSVFVGGQIGAGTGDIYAGGVQVENSSYPTSYIHTTTVAVTRNVDDLYFAFTPVPQELTMYASFNRRTDSDSSRIAQIGGAGVAPKLALLGNTTTYRAHHINGDLGQSDAYSLSGAAGIGSVVELRTVLATSGIVNLGQSINSGTEGVEVGTTPAPTGLAAAWSQQRIYIGGDGVPVEGAIALRVLRILSGTQTMATMRAPLAYIRFEDSAGLAYLSNEKPFPANRVQSWTPDSMPFGDAASTLATGALVMLRLRDDYTASFELPLIPSIETNGVVPSELASRLIYHLKKGGTCMVVTGDAAPTVYGPCGLKPGTTPQLQLSDRRTMEYTLSLALLNLAATPDHMHPPKYGNQ